MTFHPYAGGPLWGAYKDLPEPSRTLALRRAWARRELGARVMPTTGREHAPIAERVRHARRGRRGWLVASSDSGRLSLVLWRVPELRESTRSDAWRQTLPRRRGRTEWLNTLETRLGW